MTDVTISEHEVTQPSAQSGIKLPKGKPYGVVTVTPKDFLQLQSLLTEALKSSGAQAVIDGQQSIKEFAKEKIAQNLDVNENLANAIVQTLDEFESAKDAIVHKLGKLEYVKENSQMYRRVKATVDDYNHAHPETELSMPAHIIVGDKVPTAFVPAANALLVNTTEASLSETSSKAIIAHELGHKSSMSQEGLNALLYNTDQHVKFVAPNLYRACRKAGMTDEEIKKALPSDEFADFSKAATTFVPDPIPLQQTILHAGDAKEWWDDFGGMLKLNAKALVDKDCSEALKHIHDSQKAILSNIKHVSDGKNHDAELDADRKAAETYTPITVAMALRSVYRRHDIHYSALEEHQQTHPAEETRLKNLGCEVTTEKVGTSITCTFKTPSKPTICR